MATRACRARSDRDGKGQLCRGGDLAAAILEFHGARPLVVDLRSTKKPYDDDHVVAVWKQFGCFGRFPKQHMPSCDYREPIYKNTLRALAVVFSRIFF